MCTTGPVVMLTEPAGNETSANPLGMLAGPAEAKAGICAQLVMPAGMGMEVGVAAGLGVPVADEVAVTPGTGVPLVMEAVDEPQAVSNMTMMPKQTKAGLNKRNIQNLLIAV